LLKGLSFHLEKARDRQPTDIELGVNNRYSK